MVWKFDLKWRFDNTCACFDHADRSLILHLWFFSYFFQEVTRSKPVLLVISLSGIKVCSSDGAVSRFIYFFAMKLKKHWLLVLTL